ncbi:MAG: hypothetical protein JWR35_3810 [Marmoricola sp.]|nr:hypothetical protein [Marmoricola sp.]
MMRGLGWAGVHRLLVILLLLPLLWFQLYPLTDGFLSLLLVLPKLL